MSPCTYEILNKPVLYGGFETCGVLAEQVREVHFWNDFHLRF